MIDVYAASGTFGDKHSLAKDLAAAVMRWEQVPPISLFSKNTARSAGNYSQAEVLYLTAIREAERRPELASHLHCARGGLALVYQAQARYAEAESIYLDQLTEAKDSSQPDTRLHAAYMSLAGLYQDEGRYAEAEEQYKAALAETERAELWPNRGPMACTARRVARFYVSRQKYVAAEPLFKRAIEILEEEALRRDSSLPHDLKELAKFCQDQGKHAEAEDLYRRAVAVSEECRGPEDALTVHYLRDLGTFYRATGRHSEAETVYRRALATVEKTAELETARYLTPWKRLTLKHGALEGVIRNIESSVATALDHLAECYEDQQRYGMPRPNRSAGGRLRLRREAGERSFLTSWRTLWSPTALFWASWVGMPKPRRSRRGLSLSARSIRKEVTGVSWGSSRGLAK